MSYLRKIIDFSINAVGKIKRKQKIYPLKDECDGLVKVNLGCGLRVAKGWLNIDGSLNALIANWPNWMLRLVYRFSGAHNYYSLEQYCGVLKKNSFLYHDLALSLPLR